MAKVVIFAFKGEPSCFNHALLNTLDMNSRGLEARLIIEGEATRLVKNLEERNHPLYIRAKEKGLIDGICRACSQQMGALEFNETVGIPLLSDMSGHPPMSPYVEQGYQVMIL